MVHMNQLTVLAHYRPTVMDKLSHGYACGSHKCTAASWYLVCTPASPQTTTATCMSGTTWHTAYQLPSRHKHHPHTCTAIRPPQPALGVWHHLLSTWQASCHGMYSQGSTVLLSEQYD